jgi:predicted NBD/HSP70 family sugar kinase
MVHRGQSPSRAEMTAHTGLNRSTIGALVAELVALGLAIETEPSTSNRVGRPSPRVEPSPDVAVIAVNPEVDAITAAVVGLGARVEHRVRREVEHPPTPEEAAAIIAELVADLRGRAAERTVISLGIAVPGLVRAAGGDVRWAPHLGWREVPFTRIVEDAVGLPTFADNDATVGAHAEWLFGAGRGAAELVYLNGGASGIGGGVIVRGLPLGGAHGYAGEFGQNRPGLRDTADRVTTGGTLEDEVSRARLLAAVGLDTADEPTLRERLLTSTDAGVWAELERQQRILAVALANAVNVFNPELVVLGGFLATLLEWRGPALEQAVEASTVPAAWEGVQIRAAALGENRLLIGAAELALTPLLHDPGQYAPR